MATAASTSCAYCGLPVGPLWGAGAEVAYCCAGCRFAARVAGSAGTEPAEARWLCARLGLALFCSMNVMAFMMALWSSDVYDGGTTPLAGPLHGLFRYLCLFFALPVLWW